MIKVVLTGSESTGKTELVRRLGVHFDAPVSTEFVRSFAGERGGQLEFPDHGSIARGQIAAEDEAIGRARELVILDTDLVSTVVYCEHYFGRVPQWITDAAQARRGDLYLLMQPDIPWTADGIRDRGDRRTEMHELFRARLGELDASVVTIGGDATERFARAVQAIGAVVGEST